MLRGKRKELLGSIIRILLVLVDVIVINASFILALALRFDGKIDEEFRQLFMGKWLMITFVMLMVFFAFNLYKSLWRYAGIRELVQVVSACTVGSSVLFVIGYVEKNLFPRSCYIIYILLLAGFTICIRFGYRFFRGFFKASSNYEVKFKFSIFPKPKQRVLLVGAGEAASIIIKDFKNSDSNKQVVIAVDDDIKKLNARINGVPIKGTIKMIPQLVRSEEIDEIIIAMPSASKKRISEIVEICNQTNCTLKIFPGIDKALEGRNETFIRPVKIEDLLGRDEIILDNTKLIDTVKDKVILVTGGGGSIGSELCRQIVNFLPKEIIIFDIYENNAYDIQNELIQTGIEKDKIRTLIGSIRDKEKLREVFSQYHPDIVFHAAAHKHVPLMEDSPEEAIKNNVFGTLNTALCAIEFDVKKFVMISTDKAVNPTNVMGATKRICEMIIQSINETTDTTEFVAVRFGNVLGSNGSVIPLFKRQLEAGGPITVTHPDIIRYFMTIPEAVRLILEATTFAKGGEIFVLDMGEPVKILDLAKNFIKLSGFEVDKDIKIKFTGLRPGEKLYEELLMSEEGLQQTTYEKIFIGKPGDITYEALLDKLEELKLGMEQGKDIRKLLMKIVPTYHMQNENKKAI